MGSGRRVRDYTSAQVYLLWPAGAHEEVVTLKLQEYMGKELLRELGVPVPQGRVASTPEEAADIARGLGAVAVKAQVLVGGRGKAGGIKLANDADQTRQAAEDILGMDIKGLTVEKVLVEQQVVIAQEYYAGITLDRSRHCYILMLSSMGGIDIEDVAATSPDAIIRTWIDPAYGLLPFQIRDAMFSAGFDRAAFGDLQRIIAGLYELVVRKDALLAEINPLAVTEDGRAIAADAKVDLDDSSLFRHPELAALQSESIGDPLERMASEKGFAYVRLDGDIGIIGNGAGLVMMTLDVVKSVGGSPANFLDIGGGARAEVVRNAIDVLLADENVRGIVINIFGGITRGDEVAKGLLEVAAAREIPVPVAIRLAGTREAEARELLEGSAFTPAPDLVSATRSVLSQIEERSVQAAGGTR